MKDYIQIGQFKKPFGVKGAIRVRIDDAYLESFINASVLFVPESGNLVPYFVESVEEAPNLLVKMEEVDAPETARKLSNQAIFLQADAIEREGPQFDEGLIGFELIDIEAGSLGIITAIEEYPQQIMAIIANKGKELLIPLHEHLIEGIDPKKKELVMNLPEGLLEL